VRTIIAAEGACICDECVDLCVELLVKQGIERRGLSDHWLRWRLLRRPRLSRWLRFRRPSD